MSRQVISLAEAKAPFFIGIDVGGTNIKIGLVDDEGQTLVAGSAPTHEEQGVEEAVRRMAEAAKKVCQSAGVSFDQVAMIGLATPGTMDIPRGMILEPPNLPHWRNYPIRDKLAEACGRPVAFANDANAAAYGEFWAGSGRVHPSLVMLTLGTGVGGGIIYDGLSIDGENSHGSECGHIIIDHSESARRCPCGGTGHLEAYASATALVKRFHEAVAAGKTSSLGTRLAGGEELTTLMMAKAAESGDALSHELILETAYFLGAGITSLIHTIDPGLVVLGGAMNFGGHDSALGREFIERVRSEVRRRALPVPGKSTVIDFAQLGGDAGYIGAAGIARSVFLRKRTTGSAAGKSG